VRKALAQPAQPQRLAPTAAVEATPDGAAAAAAAALAAQPKGVGMRVLVVVTAKVGSAPAPCYTPKLRWEVLPEHVICICGCVIAVHGLPASLMPGCQGCKGYARICRAQSGR